MKVSVSSLAWGGDIRPDICERLVQSGVTGVEVAPTAMTEDGHFPTLAEATKASQQLQDLGLQVSAVQSILFGRPELQLFDRATWDSLREQLLRAAEVGQVFGGKFAVFGSPRNRRRESLPVDQALDIAAEFFSSVASDLASTGVALSMEPNPPGYGADFLTTYEEVVALVDAVDSPWIQPQIDTGCLLMADRDPVKAVALRMPAHVHLSAPGLGDLPGSGTCHDPLRDVLEAGGYDGWLTVEILRDRISGDDDVIKSARWAVDTYLGDEKST